MEVYEVIRLNVVDTSSPVKISVKYINLHYELEDEDTSHHPIYWTIM